MKNIVDFYPLSPMQQGMLFHSLYAPESGVYVEQWNCTLRGQLDTEAFAQAWRRLLERHTILRTAFTGEKLKEPVQVVHRQVRLPLSRQDWRGLPRAEQESRLATMLEAERRQGFDLSQPPLMRLWLLQIDEDTHHFVWSYHHLLLDGWSIPLLLNELLILYVGLRAGQEPRLPPSRPFRDYIVWLRKQDQAAAEAFWRERLRGFPAPTPLVVDRPTPSRSDGLARCIEMEIRLPTRSTMALRALAQAHGLTLNTLVQGAWALLLSRYSGEDDVLFGATVSGRPPDLEGSGSMIGLFINTLPVRVRVPPHATVLPWLKELQVQQAELHQYEYSPLVQIQGWSDVPRGTPLFDSLLVFENYPAETIAARAEGSLRVEDVQSVEQTNYPLTLVAGADERLLLRILYDVGRFAAATIDRMLGHLQSILESMAAHPEQELRAIPLLTTAERRQLLVEWNQTASSYPRERLVHQLFEAQVRLAPQATAVRCSGRNVTYDELNRRANRLAHYLQKRGVRPDVPVGLCLERSLDLIVAAIGVLKAGGAYLPMDPEYPAERLAFMLRDARAPVVLTQSHISPRLGGHEAEAIALDSDWGALAQEPDTNPASTASLRNLAYIIYTSGSTGRPKGVEIEHDGLLNLVFWHRRAFTVSSADRSTQVAGPGFDASVWELWPYLTTGACICIADAETRASPAQLRDWLVAEDITISFLPTPLAESVLSLPWPDGPVLRCLLTGGDRLHHYPDPSLPFALVNNYGPSEDTVVTTSCPVFPQRQADGAPPIGRPIANTQVYILDSHLQPVPVGVPGELYVGGIGLARGYLDRPELTSERFISLPPTLLPEATSLSSPAEAQGDVPYNAVRNTGSAMRNTQHATRNTPSAPRLYRTGDLVRYLPDGSIEFLGRIDDQIKIRGFRVELGEIEAVLREHPAVNEAVVVAREETPGDKRLVAYIVPRAGAQPDAPTLRSFLQERLPSHMVPATVLTLEALPLTPNGKVDRRALPAPEWRGRTPEAAYASPRTPVEEMLAAIWSQVLGVERVGAHDNFFELGGHSLLATQLVSRIRDALQVDLPLRALFEQPTLAGLAAEVDAALQKTQGLLAPPIQRRPPEAGTPLSFAQQRLWFLDQLEPGSPLYNISQAVRVQGRLDLAALERSLNEIVHRHEVLRSTFPTVDGKPSVVIAPHRPFTLEIVDLTGIPAVRREAEERRLALDDAQRPFDLGRGPLLRARLLRRGEEDHTFLLTMHHIISDGWSMAVLIRELGALYAALAAGEPSPLPELAVQYADYAHWQQQWLQGETLENQLAYWRKQLAGLPPLLELPTDRPRPPVGSWRGATESITLTRDLSQQLRTLGQREGATLFMTLLAAFQTLLYRYSDQEDICVGTPIANRTRAETEALIGFFVNTLVLRTDLSGEPSFRQLLKRVREVALGAYAHQDLPFEMQVEALQPERDLSHTPLFQVMFGLQNTPVEPLELPGLTLSPMEFETGVAMFDLTLMMAESPEGLVASFEYNSDLFDRATIIRLAQHFQILLEAILADPDRPISQLPLTSETERRQLLVTWNETAADWPQNACLHELFAAQARRTPHAPALVWPDFEGDGSRRRVLTYDELNRQANQLAHHLLRNGVGPGVPVALCLERSPEMATALLGILKAGGAYLPLDPNYPEARLAYLFRDAQPRLLITQSGLLGRLPAQGIEKILLDTDREALAREPQEEPASGVSAENLAYIIYTSGSTGTPKGVPVPHRGVVNHNLAIARYIELGPADRILQFSSLSFDASIEEMFPAWLSGATVVLRLQEMLSGSQLEQLVQQEQLTILDMPTAYWHGWVSEWAPERGPLPASLRLVLVGGEKALAHHLLRWQQVAGDRVVWLNTYGPTEATIVASLYEPRGRVAGEVPIGRPIANVQLYVLDRHLQPVPVGLPGELYIGGVGVASGYLNQPELSAERFLPDPFSSHPGARLYRTGDRARLRPDGNIEFLGRVDQQVKVRGFRIEPGEIESLLRQHPALSAGIVVAREDIPGDRRLVAYVVPHSGQNPSPAELRAFLQARLPDYMVPTAFVKLEELPLLPSRKVDRRALPHPGQVSPETAGTYVSPRTPAEKILAEIWSQVLGIERVGVHDDFFALGGESILSIQVVARANRAGLRLTPKQLFQNPTVEALARVASTTRATQAEQGIVVGPVPLTPIQHWFFEWHPVDPHHWNTSMLIELGKPLDMALLREALAHLLRHHDALRLRFQRTNEGWRQTIAGPECDLPFVQVDLSGLPADAQRQAIESAAANWQAAFDLSLGPLVRMVYFDLGPGQPHRLLMLFHHLVTDGVSWRIFLEDLQAAYYQLSRGEAVQLPPKTTSFRHWSHRLCEYAQTPQVRSELDYWEAIGAQEVLPLPIDCSEGANSYGSVELISIELDQAETQALLRHVPAAHSTEINSVLLAALARTFSGWTGHRTMLLELEGHGREEFAEALDLSRTMGWFTTSFPLLLNLEDTREPAQALRSVTQQLRALPSHGFGYGLLRYLCPDSAVRRRLGRLPQPQVSFNYLGQFDQLPTPEWFPFRIAAESAGPEQSPTALRSTLFDIVGIVTGGELQLRWLYSRNRHRRETVEALAAEMLENLRTLTACKPAMEEAAR